MAEPSATSVRKPLSTRLRFDIFKRDGFTCQYCGAHPPAAVLECDHITPVALGGENEPDNLITACFTCNRGKANVSLELVPQSLAERAAEVAEREEQLRGYAEVMNARRERIEREAWKVMGILFPGRGPVQRADFISVKRFVERLGVHAVLDAAECSMTKPSHRAFRYFCGICWGVIRKQEVGE
ncbi:HNH endonuclease [Rhodovarius lipocyclicus]|uniref:HNH endonuclease n=1 Tax=Rhodovarius lipocyclicus TaxID=268410 RepID=UPI0013573696|nr:HNH endonuclease [Rhodovarius lipocyclicus]